MRSVRLIVSAPVKRIDCHLHVIPPELTREGGAGEGWPSIRREGGRQVIEHRGISVSSVVREIVDIGRILDAAAARGVDHVLASPWVQLLGDMIEAEEEAIKACRIQNRAMACLTGPRVSALGTVPMGSPASAPAELERVMEIGLKGIEVAATSAGRQLGDDFFEPVWGAAERLGAIVFVHPTARGLDAPAGASYHLANAAGNPLETAFTAAHMVMAGVLERHPGLTLLLSHGGGALLALRGRLDHAWRSVPRARARLARPPEESLRRLFYDTVVHDPGLLRELAGFAGPAQVLMGTDEPFDMGVDDPIGFVRSAGLDEAAEEMVLGGNAARLLEAAART